jgi:hypothetical protein
MYIIYDANKQLGKMVGVENWNNILYKYQHVHDQHLFIGD